MSEVLVSAQGVGIKFEVPSTAVFTRWFRRENQLTDTERVWALRDVNLAIKRGEAVGLLGHNGAGKTTFLRLLSGAYNQSEGQFTSTKKTAVILDLKAGIDKSATGYQNIELLAAMRGIKNRERKALKQDVETFSELGEALNRTVATYSKGMVLRLAFAVATANPSELLLLDEIVGVGDTKFQMKAKKRLDAVIAKSGAVVVATHNDKFLKANTTRGLVFEEGRVVFDGPIREAINSNKERSR